LTLPAELRLVGGGGRRAMQAAPAKPAPWFWAAAWVPARQLYLQEL